MPIDKFRSPAALGSGIYFHRNEINMNTGITNRLIASLALCALAGFSSSAIAGQKLRSDVMITSNFQLVSVQGAIGTARNSLDNYQRIGCVVKANTVSSTVSGSCDATNAAGVRAFCITDAPQLVEVIKSIAADSYISFSYVPSATGNPTCSQINISTSSVYEPKTP